MIFEIPHIQLLQLQLQHDPYRTYPNLPELFLQDLSSNYVQLREVISVLVLELYHKHLYIL
jgi:hypothetical protein